MRSAPSGQSSGKNYKNNKNINTNIILIGRQKSHKNYNIQILHRNHRKMWKITQHKVKFSKLKNLQAERTRGE